MATKTIRGGKWEAYLQYTTTMTASELVARGYRKTSNAHHMVTRIDRPDWVAFLANVMGRSEAQFYDPRTQQPAGTWADHYRRVYSEDKHTVTAVTLADIPSSSFDPIGYVDVINAEPALEKLK